MTAWIAALAAAQLAALALLLGRLWSGRRRDPPLAPASGEITDTTVTVLLPTLEEGRRIAPCLAGLRAQRRPLEEVLVIDGGSADDTRAQVEAVCARDSRFRLVDEPPRPPGWVGKVWALEQGRSVARGEWLLGVDADVEPAPGLVAAVVAAARTRGLDIVSFSPRFAAMTAAEQLVQPAMLTTLVYRTGAVNAGGRADRVLANGQCFLARASVLAAEGGYAPARASFSDDVTLARHYASRGWRVGFLDGSRLYLVRSYESLGQMWREWGRSIDLRDSTALRDQLVDLLLLVLAQALPLPLLLAAVVWRPPGPRLLAATLLTASAVLVAMRLIVLRALAGSYDRPSIAFWLSPLADQLAVLRVVISSVRRRRRWRGREYGLRER